MKVLFVCALGMSSSIAVKALEKEAQNQGMEIEVKAVSTQAFELEVKEGYDIAMVAPQIRHRFDSLKKFADDVNVPCIMISPQGYGPLGGPKLLQQVKETLQI